MSGTEVTAEAQGMAAWRWTAWLWALVALVYLLSLDQVVGSWTDDGHYVVLAKSLASGAGYIDPSSPHPAYFPPGFPALLAPVFLLIPHFPENLVWLKLIPLAAGLGFWALSFFVIRRTYPVVSMPVATLLVAVVALHPFAVWFVGSTVMSDFPYALAVTAALVVTQRYLEDEGRGIFSARLMTAVALVAVAALIRVVGVVVLVAAVVYTVLVLRNWRAVARILVLGCLAAALIVPALLSAGRYVEMMAAVVVRGGHTPVGSLGDSPMALIAQLSTNLREFVGNALPATLFWPPYIPSPRVQEYFTPGSAGQLTRAVLSAVLVALAGAGWWLSARERVRLLEMYVLVYLALVLVAPFPQGYLRYLFPVLPFLAVYTARGCLWALTAARSTTAAASRFVVVAALLVGIIYLALDFRHIYDLKLASEPRSEFYQTWNTRMATYAWIRGAADGDHAWGVANPPQFYLYLGRPASGVPNSFDEARASGIRYLQVLCDGARVRFIRPEPTWWKDGGVEELFRSADGRECVYRVWE